MRPKDMAKLTFLGTTLRTHLKDQKVIELNKLTSLKVESSLLVVENRVEAQCLALLTIERASASKSDYIWPTEDPVGNELRYHSVSFGARQFSW